GYRFSENFAFEAGYANLGEFNASVNQTITDGVDIADVTVDADIESDGYFFSLLGIAPVSENIEIFAKLGMFFYDSDWKVRYSVTDGIDSLSDSFSGGNSDEEVNWGFGVQYSLDSKWNARLEYERFERIEADEDVGGIESDIDVLSLGIHYSF
ncbi:MAG: outer membrane beta-barrel protein, partial [bacterium]